MDRYCRFRQDVAENDPITVNGDLRTLRRALKLAAKWGKVKRDVCVAIEEIPEGPGRVRVLSPKEEQQYLAKASANLRDAAVVSVDSGVRPEELFALLWDDVDLTSRTETPNGVVHVREGKTDAAKRSVPLTPRAQDVLLRRKKLADLRPNKSVFPSSGKSGHLISLQHPHEQAIRLAKLKPFEYYVLRHTFGSRAAMAGMDKFSLCQLMGHSSPTVTERYYIHVTAPHVARGFEKFVAYSERGTAEGIADAFGGSEAVQ